MSASCVCVLNKTETNILRARICSDFSAIYFSHDEKDMIVTATEYSYLDILFKISLIYLIDLCMKYCFCLSKSAIRALKLPLSQQGSRIPLLLCLTCSSTNHVEQISQP